MPTPSWKRGATIVAIESPWVRMLCERWTDERGAGLDYWRVERAHSVIVVPIWRGRVLLPQPQFRPGVGRPTLDLPGGRLPEGRTPLEAAPLLLTKELGLGQETIAGLRALNERGWVINSSFNSQLLFGVVAMLADDAPVESELLHRAVPCTAEGLSRLVRELECLQCRAVLQEYLSQAAAP